MPGFKLAEGALQGGDLSAQLQPARCLGISRRAGAHRRDIERSGNSARIDTGVLRFAGSVGGDGVDGGGCLHGRADESSRALTADEDPLVLEALVDGANGVGVDVQGEGKIAQAGQALPRRDAAIADAGAQSPGELHAEGNLGVTVEDEVLEESLGWLGEVSLGWLGKVSLGWLGRGSGALGCGGGRHTMRLARLRAD